MPYELNRYGSNSFQPGWPLQINDNTIDSTSTSLKLPGKGVANYGPLILEDLIHIMENFAGDTPPNNPVTGQLWYDASPSSPGSGSLKIFNGINFIRVDGIEVDNTNFFDFPTLGKKGDVKFYVSGDDNKLYIHDGNDWKFINGVHIGSLPPINPINGTLWYNAIKNILYIYILSTWFSLNISSIDQNYNNGAFSVNVGPSNDNILIFVSEGSVIAVISKNNIPVSNLPTNLLLPNNITVNFQLLFPNGIFTGLNFSNFVNNSLYMNSGAGNDFKIKNNSNGKIILEGSAGNKLEISGNSNRITTNSVVEFNNNSHILLPAGSTGQRPSSPSSAVFRFNTDTNNLEFFDGIQWRTIIHSGSLTVSSEFPAGTRMLFFGTIPPGWSIVTGYNDHMIRIVDSGSGTSDSTGNSFGNVFKIHNINFAGQQTDGHTLTINEMPLHGHPFRVSLHKQTTARTDLYGGFPLWKQNVTNFPPYTGTPTDTAGQQIGGTGGNQPHSHTLSGVNYNLNLQIKYINMSLAVKN